MVHLIICHKYPKIHMVRLKNQTSLAGIWWYAWKWPFSDSIVDSVLALIAYFSQQMFFRSKQEVILKFKLSYNTLEQLIMTINITNNKLVTVKHIRVVTLCAHGLGAFWVRIDNENSRAITLSMVFCDTHWHVGLF